MATSSQAPCLPPPSPKSPFTTASTPKSARSRSLSRQSLSPGKRHVSLHELSPLKQRATPQRPRSAVLSPRKSPAKSGIQHMNVKSVSFTPQRTKQPPRAWERRPATPFVPRDEKQKIWKRVPLGEISLDHNKPAGASRREQERTKDYTRVVKKLKVGHSDEEDKENAAIAVSAKTECEDNNGGFRRVDAAKPGVNFVTMRVEEDEIWGSPKKKLRQPPGVEYDLYGETNKESDDERRETDDDLDLEQDENDQPSSDMTEDDEWQDHDLAAEEQDASSLGDSAFIKLNTAQPGPCIEPDIVENTKVESQPACEPGFISVQAAAPTTSDEQMGHLISHEAFFQNDHGSGETTDANVIGTGSESDVKVQQSVSESTEEPAPELDTVSEASNEQQNAAEALAEDNRSSSPPTILAENVTIDELAAKQFLTEAHTTEASCGLSKDQAADSEVQKIQMRQEAIPRRTSDDEAAFLRDFMSRTRAERAAREQTSPVLTEVESESVEMTDEHADESGIDTIQDTVSVPNLQPSVVELPEAAPVSPLRRSKRAVVTSIPRPQTIPNSIQLKRANGNEFIFTANKESSTANIAIVTRSNTKKNKGSALNVPVRLEQLMVEKANEENEEFQQTNNAMNAPTEGTNDKINKKRKRDRNDASVKVKKVLRWNDQNLVSYQEPPKNSVEEWEDIEDSSQEVTSEKEADEPTRHVKLTLTLTSSSKENSPPQEQHDRGEQNSAAKDSNVESREGKESSSTQSRVRRVRRGVAGSVNGTPAPKTRSKRFLDEDDQTMELHVEVEAALESSSAASAAAQGLSSNENTTSGSAEPPTTATAPRKSRMPVPSTRRGPAASASVRTAAATSSSSGLSSRAPRTLTERKEGKEPTKARNDKEAEKDDVLGRRRLRVRS